MAVRSVRYSFISDLSKVHHMRLLDDLVTAHSRYNLESVNIPTAFGLADEGYKAVVCESMTPTDERWTIALLFKIGREKRAIWHTVVSVDYVVVNPTNRRTFAKVQTMLRLLSQYVLKKSKASVVDLLVRLNSQLNPNIFSNLEDCMLNEGLQKQGEALAYVKRIRSVNKATGRNEANLPLPKVDGRAVRGLNPFVQSTIKPVRAKNGDTVRFVGRIKPGSQPYKAIYSFAKFRSDWLTPPTTERLTYMQTLFNGRNLGSIRRFVDSLVDDAHFIVSIDRGGNVNAFMAFVVGYSAPMLRAAGDVYVRPDRTIFIPCIMAESRRGVWTRDGFQSVLDLYRYLFSTIMQPGNVERYDLIGAQSTSQSVHSSLLQSLGFALTASFSNAPAHPYNTEFYARPLIQRTAGPESRPEVGGAPRLRRAGGPGARSGRVEAAAQAGPRGRLRGRPSGGAAALTGEARVRDAGPAGGREPSDPRLMPGEPTRSSLPPQDGDGRRRPRIMPRRRLGDAGA